MSTMLQAIVVHDNKHCCFSKSPTIKIISFSFHLCLKKRSRFVFHCLPFSTLSSSCSTARTEQTVKCKISDLFRKLAREQPGNIKILQRLPLNPSLRPTLCDRVQVLQAYAHLHAPIHHVYAHTNLISRPSLLLIHAVCLSHTHTHRSPDRFCLSSVFELCPTLLSIEKLEKSY